jgi:type IV pilus assembly protein PilA
MRRRVGSEGGFTLIELLVVILIIGILAAIAIPSFLSQKNKAYAAQAQSLVRSMATAMEAYGTSHNGEFTGATMAALHEVEPTIPEGAQGGLLPSLSGVGQSEYTVTVEVEKSSEPEHPKFWITREASGANKYQCTATKISVGCTPTGEW